MDLLNNQKADSISKPEIENVQKEKQEYKLIGTVLRTHGLRLYAYDSKEDKIFEVKIEIPNTLYTKPVDGKLVLDYEQSYKESQIDPRNEHFEALNMSNAYRRVSRYRRGLIKELCNLRFAGERENLNIF